MKTEISQLVFGQMLKIVKSGGTISEACKKAGVYRQLLDKYPKWKRELKEAKCLTATTGRARGQSGLNHDVINKHLSFEFQDFI